MYRAGHQIVDRPVLFVDPIALPILGMSEVFLLDHPITKRVALRAHIVARSLLAEATLAAAYQRGVRQYVLLGAGLDTFAYRNPHAGLRVFEVDHPATQAWKRARLSAADIESGGAVFAPIDFEAETLAEALVRAGFDASAPAVFAWLGVLPYLTSEAIRATLIAIGAMAAGSEIVFDYGEPPEFASARMAAAAADLRARVAEIGEPIISTFAPTSLAVLLGGCGFSEIEDLNGAAVNDRFFQRGGLSTPPDAIAHLIRARV